jgi:hypothetical protein
MALKDFWVDKVDGVDDVIAKDINDIASGVIALENANGDIETALDNIIAIQEELIGTITFTFNGVTYSALRGMTWAEWCDSKYNTIGLYTWDDGTVLTPNDNTIGTANYDYVDITGDLVIIEGETYMEL